MKRICLGALLLSLLSFSLSAQKKREVKNDSNTPLHLLEPEYKTPYGTLDPGEIKESIDRIFHYIDANTPARVTDKRTGRVIEDYEKIDADSQLERGLFRLTSYEWGVTYSALLAAAEVTGDQAYREYVTSRFRFFSEVTPHFRRVLEEYGETDPQIRKVLTPQALDDAGAICAAMIKAQLKDKSLRLNRLIDNYIYFIRYQEHRLADGTFARNRPLKNSVWLDDLYMGVPSLAWMGRHASDNQDTYYSEAVRQVLQFSDRMFVPEKKLYRHGWVEGMEDHPSFHWGRANGWALLAKCEVLDALPKNHPQREKIIDLLRTHIQGLAACQGGDGFWHQLLDRNDSYLETSSTAIFVYCIAHAINQGWIDAMAYGPVAHLGWQAVASKINAKGEVEGTCVGTGMAFDPAFYYYRPVNVYAAHGYGPAIWAGSEMIRLLQKRHPKMNDSAIQYYREVQESTSPLFEEADPRSPSDIVSGKSRQGNKPVAFYIGDSTVKCGKGEGEGDMWGWGSFLPGYFDPDRITCENWAMGGRSSRTYFTEGLWNKTLPGIRKGDYLLIQFGHNDGGPLNTGRARASLKGTGEETETVVMERDGRHETVRTFGSYLRMYVRQAKARGATVILLSPTATNKWTGDKINRNNETYGKWAKEVAEQEGVFFIDLNGLSADKLEPMGKEKSAAYFVDGTHNTREGALMNCESIIEGLRNLSGCPLKNYIK